MMSIQRTAYLLTTNPKSEKCIFSRNVLVNIGFIVDIINIIPSENKVLSNKKTMLSIYQMITTRNDTYAYIFEEGINIIENIKLDEIIEYETISYIFLYLGMCEYGYPNIKKTNHIIRNYPVFSKSGNVRGIHAIGISKVGAQLLLEYSNKSSNAYMDMILEEFSTLYPANVVRYNLKSPYVVGHCGIIFQDRVQFPSTIS
jgi:hypothetical protein